MKTYDTVPDFVALDNAMLEHWRTNDIFGKTKQKNADKPPFRYLDGPITANNPMGVHHAWGRSIKDTFLRYKTMTGHSCHYRNGFDSQGLWVEVEVEKSLGFKDKQDILAYGMDNFVHKCMERVDTFSKRITEQSIRLGQQMDWDNSYYTHTDLNIQGIWHFLHKCHEMGLIDKAHRAMPWCPRCGTSLSEHEMSGSYKELTHMSVYVRLPLKERDVDMLVWTTTPWTLTANVALAVNPENDYVIVETDGCPRPLCLGRERLGLLTGKKKILEQIKGAELVGLTYDTCFPELPIQNFTHKVIAWEDVAATDGSGVVHIAPGCGAEDFELGKRYDLQEICPVDEGGKFTSEYGDLVGMGASEARDIIFDKLDKAGKLYRTEAHTHSYPVCWRCKTEVLFRLVREWYIKTEPLKARLLAAVDTVKWTPAYLGKRMSDWLENMGDWNISRKRFYGLPLPFYPCEHCGKLTVIESREELEKRAVKTGELPNLHRPWIDAFTIRCDCGAEVSRIPEVGDVWLDAGIVPFSTLGYFDNREMWEKYYPAEWVVEMREQIRLWFYSMLFMSVTLLDRAPYEHVMAHNSVVSEDGSRFNKTGYMIQFDEAADRVGADTIRYLFAGANMTSDVRFGYNLCDEAKRKMLGLWNCYVFFMTYADIEKPDVITPIAASDLDITDVWLGNRINAFIRDAKAAYEAFDTPAVVAQFEQCIDDVSNWYIRINRRRFWKSGQGEDKRGAYVALYNAIRDILTVMAPIIPFATDYIWQHMVRPYEPNAAVSVHLGDFPSLRNIDEDSLRYAAKAREVITLALKLRNEQQLKVRQPLSLMRIAAVDHADIVAQSLKHYGDIINDELNIKQTQLITDTGELYDRYLTLNFKEAGRALKGEVNAVKELLSALSADEIRAAMTQYDALQNIAIGQHSLEPSLFTVNTKPVDNVCIAQESGITIALDTTITPELAQEGLYRELLRQCQVQRKEAGFNVSDRIHLNLSSDNADVQYVLSTYGSRIAEETLAVSFNAHDSYTFERTIEIDEIPVTVRMAVI